MRIGAPLAHVNQAALGPPCRSIAISKRSRRSRRAIERSSRTRARPRRLGATTICERWGLPRTTSRAAGCLRLMARSRGVVSTTSPISRSRTIRIFIGRGCWLVAGGWPTNYQLLSSRFRLNRGFVDEHDRDVVLDRIDTVTGGALERGAVFHELHRGLAVGTRENFEQLCVDRHAGNYSILS